jgi:hypothetical protein
MSRTSLVSVNVRREAREYLVAWTLREIGDLFHDHGFSADMTHDPQTSGERRTYVEQFYSVVDWSDRDQVERMLPVFEALLDDADSHEMTDANAASVMWSAKFARLLSRDGFDRDDIGRLRPRWVSLSAQAIDALPAESAIPMLLRRMWDNVEDNPDAAIGAAKEAIEATAKHILTAAGESIGEVEKMPGLIARSQETLGVHAKVVDSSKRASDSIKAILGSLSKVALGVNELRCDYGTGHGRPRRATGLNSRHARLAAQSADAWVRFMLDTAQARADELASQAS